MQPSSWNAVNVSFVSSNAKGFESWILCNAHDILSYLCDFDLIFFLFVENTNWLSLSERCDNSWDLILSFCKSLRGLPQSVCFVLFSHLTILEWRQWSRVTFNQSTEILILGFSPFFFKNFNYFAQQENIRLWDRSCAPLKDGNGLSHFGMRPSETFLILDRRVMPRVYRSCWNLMTWVDPEKIYTTKAPFGFKRSPKESAWATNIKCNLLSQLSLGIFHELLVEWVFFWNVQVQNLEDFFYIYIFSTIKSVCEFHSRIPT